MWNFLLLCVHYTPLLMLFNIELLRKRNIFTGREESWCLGRGNKLVSGLRRNTRASPPPHLNDTLVCVASPVAVVFFFCCCWLRWLLPGYILEYLKVLYHGSANLPHNLRIKLQILKRFSLVRFRPVVYLASEFYTEQNKTCHFSESYLYSPSCLPQTQKVVVSSQLHWLLVYWSAI